LLKYLPISVYVACVSGVSSIGALMTFFAHELPALPNETMHTGFKDALMPIRLLQNVQMLLLLPTLLARISITSFNYSLLPILLPSLEVVPFVQISYALCLLASQLVLLVAWTHMKIHLWAALNSSLIILSMVLTWCTSFINSLQLRLDTFYVIAGLIGLSTSIGLSLLNAFVASLFPHDPKSVFALVRGLEGNLGSQLFV
jgi:hypothetical protein